MRKSKGIEGLIETENPNARKQKMNISKRDLAAGNFQKAELSRREREALEADAAERRHWRLTAEGKTEQSQKDQARLAEIRARREASKKKREEEKQAEADRLAAEQLLRSRKEEEVVAAVDEVDKPSKIQIKKMKPTLLKEALKARGLSTQGNKKALQARLLQACGY